MRRIEAGEIKEVVSRLCLDANFILPHDVVRALRRAKDVELLDRAKEVLETILENSEIALKENIPICQDTGIVVVFLEIGQDVVIVNGDLKEAVDCGVRDGYKKGYLRYSIVKDPFIRENTNDNTPAILHSKIVSGDTLKIRVMPKGSGSENMSSIKMFKPSDGMKGVEDYVVSHIRNVAPFSCPPLVVGIGIGGTFETCAILAKEALFREIGSPNPREDLSIMEDSLLRKINNLGIGPCGLGGKMTALAVHIETIPTHIASLPVAININCHAHRHKEKII